MTAEDETTGERSMFPFGARAELRLLRVQIKQLRADRDAKGGQLTRIAEMARELVIETKNLRAQRESHLKQIAELGAFTKAELETQLAELELRLTEQRSRLDTEREKAKLDLEKRKSELELVRSSIINMEEVSLLQQAGVYRYRHPLTDAISYQSALARIQDQISVMVRKDGGAVLATTS